MKLMTGDMLAVVIALIVFGALIGAAMGFGDLVRAFIPAIGRYAVPVDWWDVSVKGAVASVGFGGLVGMD